MMAARRGKAPTGGIRSRPWEKSQPATRRAYNAGADDGGLDRVRVCQGADTKHVLHVDGCMYAIGESGGCAIEDFGSEADAIALFVVWLRSRLAQRQREAAIKARRLALRALPGGRP